MQYLTVRLQGLKTAFTNRGGTFLKFLNQAKMKRKLIMVLILIAIFGLAYSGGGKNGTDYITLEQPFYEEDYPNTDPLPIIIHDTVYVCPASLKIK